MICQKCSTDKLEIEYTINKKEKKTCDACIKKYGKSRHGKCKLCLQQKDLRLSHIIPNFMYKGMKDNQGDIIHFTIKGGGKSTKEATEYLLCSDCENTVLNNKYEDISAKLLKGSFCERQTPKLNSVYTYNNIIIREFRIETYKVFKNFVLSILWRCSVYSGEKINNISLGELHEEELRKIVHNNEDTEDDKYPVTVWNITNLYLSSKISLKDIIVSPFKIKIDNTTHYYMFINGLIYDVTVSSHGSTNGSISKNNTITIIDYPEKCYHLLEKIFKLKINRLS